MLRPSHAPFVLAGLSVACGSADASLLTGERSPIAGSSGTAGVSGGASGMEGNGAGGFWALGGWGGATAVGGLANPDGAASAGGATFGAGGANRGGAPEAGGAFGGGGGAGGRPPTTLPSGGIITPQCAACANTHCPAELAACGAEPACRAAEECMTKCSLVDCISCVPGAPSAFSGLFSGCLKQSCPTVCPSVT
jgi:hypothetical protein